MSSGMVLYINYGHSKSILNGSLSKLH